MDFVKHVRSATTSRLTMTDRICDTDPVGWIRANDIPILKRVGKVDVVNWLPFLGSVTACRIDLCIA